MILQVAFNYETCTHENIIKSLQQGLASQNVGYHANSWTSGFGASAKKFYEGFVNVGVNRFYMDDATAQKCAEKTLRSGDKIILTSEPTETMVMLYEQSSYNFNDED